MSALVLISLFNNFQNKGINSNNNKPAVTSPESSGDDDSDDEEESKEAHGQVLYFNQLYCI